MLCFGKKLELVKKEARSVLLFGAPPDMAKPNVEDRFKAADLSGFNKRAGARFGAGTDMF
jgi:hypothetical protein